MELNVETRAALLDGSDYGFASAKTAPRHMQERIIEIRHAMVEKRPVPKPSAVYVQRSIAAGTVSNKVVCTSSLEDVYFEQTGKQFQRPAGGVRKTNTPTLEQLSKRSGVPLADLQAAQLRGRAERLGAQIRIDRFANKSEPTAIEAHLDCIGMSPAPWEK